MQGNELRDGALHGPLDVGRHAGVAGDGDGAAARITAAAREYQHARARSGAGDPPACTIHTDGPGDGASSAPEPHG